MAISVVVQYASRVKLHYIIWNLKKSLNRAIETLDVQVWQSAVVNCHLWFLSAAACFLILIHLGMKTWEVVCPISCCYLYFIAALRPTLAFSLRHQYLQFSDTNLEVNTPITWKHVQVIFWVYPFYRRDLPGIRNCIPLVALASSRPAVEDVKMFFSIV